MPVDLTELVVSLVELSLFLAGAILLWRVALRPAARARRRVEGVRLPAWEIAWPDFLLCALVIVISAFAASIGASLILRAFDLSSDSATILGGTAFQFGLLVGASFAPLALGHHPLRPPLDRATLVSGLVTFLVALPIVAIASLVWIALLRLTGLPAEQQDLLRMFAQSDSNTLLVLMIALATIIAPIAEELLFRATFFRYLRTRWPRWLALSAPGFVFAAMHVNWVTFDGLVSLAPLTTLAIVFSLAYERTGRIGTAIVAHALFNAHTIVILLTGVVPT